MKVLTVIKTFLKFIHAFSVELLIIINYKHLYFFPAMSNTTRRSAATNSSTTETTSSTLFDEDGEEETYTEDDFYGHNVLDCPLDQIDNDFSYLHERDRDDIRQAKEINWSDSLISDPDENIHFVFDEAIKGAWEKLQEEVSHIRQSLLINLGKEESDSIQFEDLLELAFGQNSDFTRTFCEGSKIKDRPTFLRFISTLCLQMSYKECPSSLYEDYSQLRDKVPMKKDEYMNIWKNIATGKKVSLSNFIGASRREECMWEQLERVINTLLRKITVVGRNVSISISLDDDKIWLQVSGMNLEDDFGLRRVQHVRDNRKGIVAHTAISSASNLPLHFMFERNGDGATDCFKRIFSKMFNSNQESIPDLNGIVNHSDRGYTIQSTIFDFLIPAGCDLTHTVKRIMPFPFVWGMRISDNDVRENLDEKGAPALFVKETLSHNRLVTCTAFRTGTKNVSAVISTLIHGHQWEGICLSSKQRSLYERDAAHGLDKYVFQALTTEPSLFSVHKYDIQDIFDDLRLINIDVLTIEQGTADWHKGRQFSMTSSQASGAFKMALILNQLDDDWCDVASYLFGEKYHERK